MYTATDDEKKDLEAVARISVCDSTSDDHDRPGPDGAELGEVTDDDVKFMAKAKEASRQSHDQQTKASLMKNFNDSHALLSLSQVGAVIVDPQTKEVVGTGWNRMPRGCENKFNWTRDKEKEPLESGKHYYGKYAWFVHIVHVYDTDRNTLFKQGVNDLMYTVEIYYLFPIQSCMLFEQRYLMPTRREPIWQAVCSTLLSTRVMSVLSAYAMKA